MSCALIIIRSKIYTIVFMYNGKNKLALSLEQNSTFSLSNIMCQGKNMAKNRIFQQDLLLCLCTCLCVGYLTSCLICLLLGCCLDSWIA